MTTATPPPAPAGQRTRRRVVWREDDLNDSSRAADLRLINALDAVLVIKISWQGRSCLPDVSVPRADPGEVPWDRMNSRSETEML